MLRLLIATGLIALALAFASAAYFRVRNFDDIRIAMSLSGEINPLWIHLALRRVTPEGAVTDLLLAYPPTRREEFGSYGFIITRPHQAVLWIFPNYA
jgi:hypothetical protein